MLLGLQCLSHISEKHFYGVTVLIDVLRGSQSKRITEAKLNEVAEYGKLGAVNREDLNVIVDWLIENHFILQTKGMYPVLHPTYEGTHYSETITDKMLVKLRNKLEND